MTKEQIIQAQKAIAKRDEVIERFKKVILILVAVLTTVILFLGFKLNSTQNELIVSKKDRELAVTQLAESRKEVYEIYNSIPGVTFSKGEIRVDNAQGTVRVIAGENGMGKPFIDVIGYPNEKEGHKLSSEVETTGTYLPEFYMVIQ